jgi:hypothetical protein
MHEIFASFGVQSSIAQLFNYWPRCSSCFSAGDVARLAGQSRRQRDEKQHRHEGVETKADSVHPMLHKGIVGGTNGPSRSLRQPDRQVRRCARSGAAPGGTRGLLADLASPTRSGRGGGGTFGPLGWVIHSCHSLANSGMVAFIKHRSPPLERPAVFPKNPWSVRILQFNAANSAGPVRRSTSSIACDPSRKLNSWLFHGSWTASLAIVSSARRYVTLAGPSLPSAKPAS